MLFVIFMAHAGGSRPVATTAVRAAVGAAQNTADHAPSPSSTMASYSSGDARVLLPRNPDVRINRSIVHLATTIPSELSCCQIRRTPKLVPLAECTLLMWSSRISSRCCRTEGFRVIRS